MNAPYPLGLGSGRHYQSSCGCMLVTMSSLKKSVTDAITRWSQTVSLSWCSSDSPLYRSQRRTMPSAIFAMVGRRLMGCWSCRKITGLCWVFVTKLRISTNRDFGHLSLPLVCALSQVGIFDWFSETVSISGARSFLPSQLFQICISDVTRTHRCRRLSLIFGNILGDPVFRVGWVLNS